MNEVSEIQAGFKSSISTGFVGGLGELETNVVAFREKLFRTSAWYLFLEYLVELSKEVKGNAVSEIQAGFKNIIYAGFEEELGDIAIVVA